VDGQLVAREMLPIALRKELNSHATTTTYFEADDNSGYGQCIYAIDTIKSLGADFIWITPGIRYESNRDAHR
jgi:biopolymer transport protein ExbD